MYDAERPFFARYNRLGAQCGERIPLDDYYFGAYQAGEMSEADLLRLLRLDDKPPMIRNFWIACISREKEHPAHG